MAIECRSGDVCSTSMREKSKDRQLGRNGELNALAVLHDEWESSDSDRLRLICIVTV